MKTNSHEGADFDVVICGGGLAGLALARQLHLTLPECDVLVLEKERGPLPESAFKVGESTIESGAYYFARILQLEDYLEEAHLEKLGLRYFYGDAQGPFWQRPEFGVARFLPAKSYQLDRGLLENHLRRLVVEDGVRLEEGVTVKDIELQPDGRPHRVTYRQDGRIKTVRCRWVIDAMGRRRFLQRKLGLAKENEGIFNSSWFRIKGKFDVSRLVPRQREDWHGRVAEPRWHSTNHLMGKGYWVWLIPLSPGNTSVGIVASEEFHPFSQYDSFPKAMAWLERHEPKLAERLEDIVLMDFKKLRNYSYTSDRVFSENRWSCVGEAGVFVDPFYSVGSNMIAFANGITTRLIERDFAGTLSAAYVTHENRIFLSLNDALADTIHQGYPYHHNNQVMALKTIWDYYIGWTTTDPQLYHEIYLDEKQSKAMSNLINRVIVAQGRMMALFREWGARKPSLHFGFIDYIEDLPTLRRLFVTNLPPKAENFRTILNNLREAIRCIEELAQVIFFLAVEDMLPEKLPLFEAEPWVNITAISLQPELWDAEGLFKPRTKPRDLGALDAEIRRIFGLKPRIPALEATS